jgi:hypothetical protein
MEEHAMAITVLDPRQSAEGEALRPAAPLTTLRGTVVGMIDNAKIGTERFYDHLEDILRTQYGVRDFIRRRKPDATRPVPPAMLGELMGADAIITGIGD